LVYQVVYQSADFFAKFDFSGGVAYVSIADLKSHANLSRVSFMIFLMP
jgi:hypothetical protein